MRNAKNKTKLIIKKIRSDRKQTKLNTKLNAASTYPEDVEAALTYFSENGFELSQPLQVEALDAVRKTLARVFHPDKGGTHAEIIMLNENHAVIANYLG